MHGDIILTMAQYSQKFAANSAYIAGKKIIIYGKYKYLLRNNYDRFYIICKNVFNYDKYIKWLYVTDTRDGDIYYYIVDNIGILECRYRYDINNDEFNIRVICEKDKNIKYTISIDATIDNIKIYSYKWGLVTKVQYHNEYEYSVENSPIYQLAHQRIARTLQLKIKK